MFAGVVEVEGFFEPLVETFAAGYLAFFQKMHGFVCQPAASQIAGLAPLVRLVLLAVRRAHFLVPSMLAQRSSSRSLLNLSGGCNLVLESPSESLFSSQGRQVIHGLC